MGGMSRALAGCIALVVVVGAAGCLPPFPQLPFAQLPPHDTLVRANHSVEYEADVTWLTLPNGMRVAFLPDAHANVVSVDVRYLTGAADDPPGKPGLAHLVEHVMFEQRSEPGGPTIADRLQLAALDSNASTTMDATHFHAIALAANLDLLLAIEADRLALGCHGVDPPTFERERSVVGQELFERGPQTLARLLVADVLGAGHAYAHGPGGDRLPALTLADVCSFVDAHYAPDRAILVIGGKFDPAAARAAVEAHFGELARRATAPPARAASAAPARKTTKLRVPGAMPRAIVVLSAEPWGSSDALDEELLDDLVELQIAEHVRSAPWIGRVDHGRLGGARSNVRYFSIGVRDAAHLGDATALLSQILSELTWGAPDAPLATIAARKKTELFDRFESLAGRAQMCADALQFASDSRCGLRTLRWLNDDARARVRRRATRAVSQIARVVHVVPGRGDAPGAPLALAPPAAEVDAPVWRAVVDRSEADRPIALLGGLRSAAVSEFTLPSGLRVVLAGNFTQPIVEARLVFGTGSTGLDLRSDTVAYLAADLLEHDLTRPYRPDDVATLSSLFLLGAEITTQVTDHTTFRIRGAAAFADWYLWRLSWLLRDGVYHPSDLLLVRNMLVRALDRPDDHDRRLRRMLREALFGRDHPFVRRSGRDAVAAVPLLADLVEFRDAHYVPRGATLIVTGGFDPVAMRRTVLQLFGDWQRGSPPPPRPPIPAMRPEPGPTWIVDDEPGAPQVRLLLGFVAKSIRPRSLAARAVLVQLLRGRLALIRTQMGASYGVEARYEGRVDAARAGEVVRRIVADLDELRASAGEFQADFVRARRAALAVSLADPSMPGATARRLEDAVAIGLPLTGESLTAAIAATTARDVAQLISQDLQPARMVALVSGRADDTAAALAAAGITGARRVG